jgi:hypothetical protein
VLVTVDGESHESERERRAAGGARMTAGFVFAMFILPASIILAAFILAYATRDRN